MGESTTIYRRNVTFYHALGILVSDLVMTGRRPTGQLNVGRVEDRLVRTGCSFPIEANPFSLPRCLKEIGNLVKLMARRRKNIVL